MSFRMETSGGSSESDGGYETGLTDPEICPTRACREGRTDRRARPRDRDSAPPTPPKQSTVVPIDPRLFDPSLLGARGEDPLDDTDEDLSDVDPDYGGSGKTKKLKNRVEDRWRR